MRCLGVWLSTRLNKPTGRRPEWDVPGAGGGAARPKPRAEPRAAETRGETAYAPQTGLRARMDERRIRVFAPCRGARWGVCNTPLHGYDHSGHRPAPWYGHSGHRPAQGFALGYDPAPLQGARVPGAARRAHLNT